MTSRVLSLCVLASTFAFVGCAVQHDRTEFKGLGFSYHSNVKQLENGNYFVEVEAAPGQGRISAASAAARKDASEFCHSKNKGMKVVEEMKESHLLINGVARLTFSCQ